METPLGFQLSHYFPILFKLRGFMHCAAHHKETAFKSPEGNVTELGSFQI